MPEHELSHDHLLSWLNDHLGETVSAYVCADIDGATESVVGYAQALGAREDIAGLYNIGEMFLDLRRSAIDASLAAESGVEVVNISLGEDVELRIVSEARRRD